MSTIVTDTTAARGESPEAGAGGHGGSQSSQPLLARGFGRAHAGGSSVPTFAGLALCLLLAVAQVALAGYQMGVGNQSIQIAFLKRLADPTLFPRDDMVNLTMPMYPSYFFWMLSPLAKVMDVATLYLLLQIITSFATLASIYWLSRSIYRTHTAALAAAGILVAGHLEALAGDRMYSEGFTHTYAALPLAILALALAYRARWVGAFAVAGILFNIHALTAAYAALMLGAALFADFHEIPARKWWQRAIGCGVVFLLLASPTLRMMQSQHQVFTADWVNLMRIRSPEHSFPSTWWKSLDPDLPRFALFMGLFVLSWSFSPVRRAQRALAAAPPPPDARIDEDSIDVPMAMDDVRRAARITVLMTIAVLALFAAGYVFTEVWPIPTVIRLQPFRASRLLMALMLVHIVHGAVTAMRVAVHGWAAGTDGRPIRLALGARLAEIVSGLLILLTIALPWLLPLLPLTLVVAIAAAFITGHLSWRQALVAVGALLVALLAYLQIQFPLPGLTPNVLAHRAVNAAIPIASLGGMAAVSAAIFALMIAVVKVRELRATVVGFVVVVGGLLCYGLFIRERAELAREEFSGNAAQTSGLASWARETLPKDALFLTPSGFSNFRVSSERSLVGDWRDGTQLYFCAAFGPSWLERVSDIEPGFELSRDRTRLTSRGDDLETLSDADLIKLADKYKASYIILKNDPKKPRTLVAAYTDKQYSAYQPRLVALASRPAPPGVINPVEWNAMESFMANTVQPNIEKYRKADLSISLQDADGRPVQELPIKLDQTNSAFTFGGSLGWMEPDTNKVSAADGDYDPPPAKPIEMEKLPEVFNGSMIPFSSKWAFIEPQKGVYHWSDLDKYVDYALKNNLTLEFHHLTGIRPVWTNEIGGVGGMTGLNFPPIDPRMQTEFNRHCMAVLDRYGDKIKYYQVVNEKFMMQYVPAAWKLMKEKYPNIQFGLSDCVNFWSPGGISGAPLMRRGDSFQFKGVDAVKWLNDQGIKPDFFSIHGHHPANLWADPREMYAVVDAIHDLGPRVHVSEEYLQLNASLTGPVRVGYMTPQIQADYLVRYFTVLFSHPAVDMVNLWGAMAATGWSNTGILDDNGKPRPAFDALKKLFKETWRTHLAETLGLDGTLNARVFHGTYTVSVALPDGKSATTTLTVPEKPDARFRLKLDAAKGTLEVLP